MSKFIQTSFDMLNVEEHLSRIKKIRKRKTILVEIDKCTDCPYVNDGRCNKTNKYIQLTTIPNWCPLLLIRTE